VNVARTPTIAFLLRRIVTTITINLRDSHHFFDFGQRRISVAEELWDRRSHREIHVQLPLGFLQREFTSSKERHDASVV